MFAAHRNVLVITKALQSTANSRLRLDPFLYPVRPRVCLPCDLFLDKILIRSRQISSPNPVH